jgi:predicted outer membrane repeat protein
VCDGLDNDCNGLEDDGLPQLYVDRDRDGFGTTPIDDCTVSIPSATQDGDCDDNNSNRFPGNLEICDEIDNDCSAATSEAGVATLFPANGNPPRNLDTTSLAVTVIADRDDNAEVRFCSGTFDMTFQFQNNSQPLLMSGLGRVELKPVVSSDRIMYVENSVVEFNNLEIVDGGFFEGGGGMYCINSAVTLNAVRFRNNTSSNGGAILADNCQLFGSQVSFINNSATSPGGAIVQIGADSDLQWSASQWTDNNADRSLTVWDSTASLTTPFFNDTTDVGIYLVGDSVLSITNGDFSGNSGIDLQFSDGFTMNLGANANITCTSPENTCISR